MNNLSIQNFDSDGNIVSKPCSKGLCTVMFFVEWCGHCQQAKPIFKKIANSAIQTSCALVDCEKERDLVKIHNIKGYPTFKQFKDGKYLREFKGLRTPDRMLLFVLGREKY